MQSKLNMPSLFMLLSILDVFATRICTVWEQKCLVSYRVNLGCKNIQNGKQREYSSGLLIKCNY